ncbi:MAG TPA: gluconate 2-dehydrogenase subunit 3 family protein [Bryobacteraceae bacterium]|nr:gluconate 2-dehydrogenase subunit 3 family protein [Bryobacteraceae bacterium]
MTRRDLGWLLGRAAAGGAAQEFLGEWLRAAQTHAHAGANPAAPPEPDRWSAYRPKFFNSEDFRALEAFASILIPTDDAPGAREAHVAHFLDFLVAAAAEYAPEMQAEWRRAMEWLRGRNFAGLSAEQQAALVAQMAAPERDRNRRHPGFPVYRLIKRGTVFAFYTSRAGLVEALEYKGNAYLEQFPACDHPEHRQA